MIKKLVSIILALLLCISSCLVAFAAKPVTLTVIGGEAYAGEELEVQIRVSDNSKIAGAVIELHYDANKLEYVNSWAGGILDSNGQISIRNNKKGVVTLAYLSTDSEIYAEGILMNVMFKTRSDASGDAELYLKINNQADFIDLNTNKIKYEFKNSKITIINNSISETVENETDETISETTTLVETTNNIEEDSSENTQNEENHKSVISLSAILIVIGAILIAISVALFIAKRKKGEE